MWSVRRWVRSRRVPRIAPAGWSSRRRSSPTPPVSLARSAAWRGCTLLVTAGPTREPLDPVRTLSNRSSGKMGYRLAEAAWRRGADVTLISGPSAEPDPVGVRVIRVDTTAGMAAAVLREVAANDVLIMAAAPADYRVASPADEKLPRQDGELTLRLLPTDDILLATVPARPEGMTVVGFALETGDAEAKGRAKLERKGLDLIVINDANEAGAGFDVATNAVTILDRRGGRSRVSLRSKSEVAECVLDAVEAFRG